MGCGLPIMFLTLVVSSIMIGVDMTETQNLTICEGEKLTLSCDHMGSASNVTWTHVSTGNGSDVMEVLRCNMTCNYTVDSVTPADTGLYNCSVDSMTVSSYDVVVPTIPPPVCSSTPMNVGRTGNNSSSTGVIYVPEGDNVSLTCSVQGSSPVSLSWFYRANGTSTSLGEVEMEKNLTVNLIEGIVDEMTMPVFTCQATANGTCAQSKNCTVGPISVITDKNFYIERPNETIYVGDNVTLECVTNITGTETRWVNGNGINSSLRLENVSLNVSGIVFLCELFETAEPGTVLDTRMTTIVVVNSTTILPSRPMTSIPSESSSTESTDVRTSTDNSTDGMTTVLPTSGSSLPIAAIAGGAAGGAVFLILIIILIICLCRSNRKSDVSGDHTVHRTKKKEGSKKHRSGILSLRHKLDLFSTPFDVTDDDEEKASHNALADTDVETVMTEYRPQSKIPSQIRVKLEADDGDEGTVENGFLPEATVAASDEDESPYSMGVVEGRYGIIGQGTFAAANTESEKPVDSTNKNQNRNDDDDDVDAETVADGTELYTKVYNANTPGDSSFDNMTYGCIEGVDEKSKAAMYDERQETVNLPVQDGKPPESNETDNATDIDTSKGSDDAHGKGDVTNGASENTDVTEDNSDMDRESAYAEISP